jgi:hypothetical protein
MSENHAFTQFRAAADNLLADMVEWMDGVPGKCHLFDVKMKGHDNTEYKATALNIVMSSQTVRISPTGFSLSMTLNMTVTGNEPFSETVTYVISQPADKLADQSWTIQKMGLLLGRNRLVRAPTKQKLTKQEFCAVLGEAVLSQL